MKDLRPQDIARVRALAAARLLEIEAGRALEEYRTRPLDFIEEVLKVPRNTIEWSLNEGYDGHEWDGDPDPLLKAANALADGRYVGIASGTGTGKSYLLACLMFWWLACWEDSLVISIAPKEAQLVGQMWREARTLFPAFQTRFPNARLLEKEIRVRGGTDDTWGARAFPVGVGADEESAVRAQGWHAEHMLLIVEEGPGVHDAIWTALGQTRTGEHNLQIAVGNPVGEGDALYEWVSRPDVVHVTASALDAPNVVTGREIVPGAVGRSSVREREIEAQVRPGIYESRVRGRFPSLAIGAGLDQYDPKRHTLRWSDEEIRSAVAGGWPVYIGMDPGTGWAVVFGVVDTEGRMRVVREMLVQRGVSSDVAEGVLEVLDDLGCERPARIWSDSAASTENREVRRVLKRLGLKWNVTGSVKRPIRGDGGVEQQYRAGFVTRANQLLHDDRLLFVEGLGAGMEWRRGASGQSAGTPETGSRLLWEIRRWRYPDRATGRIQARSPDDSTADGAHAIAALRYLLMGWLDERPRTLEEKAARARRILRADASLARTVPIPPAGRDILPSDGRDRDYGLERQTARRAMHDPWHRAVGRRVHQKRVQAFQARQEARKAAVEKERAERQKKAEEAAQERDKLAALDPIVDAIERSGLAVDDAVDRLLCLD